MAGKRPRIDKGRLPYRRNKSILTAAELAFYRVLVKSVDSWYVICPKVNLADLFAVSRKKVDRVYRNKINQKHVDFLLCAASTMAPVLGIELDDSTHDRDCRHDRDDFVDEVYGVAGLPLLHIRATATYDSKLVASLVHDAARNKVGRTRMDAHLADTPICPQCKLQMVLRWSKKGRREGDAFWGCPNFPACEQVLNSSI